MIYETITYKRFCKRCNKMFRPTSRYSKICPNCYKGDYKLRFCENDPLY